MYTAVYDVFLWTVAHQKAISSRADLMLSEPDSALMFKLPYLAPMLKLPDLEGVCFGAVGGPVAGAANGSDDAAAVRGRHVTGRDGGCARRNAAAGPSSRAR